jgi:hypothetical protein
MFAGRVKLAFFGVNCNICRGNPLWLPWSHIASFSKIKLAGTGTCPYNALIALASWQQHLRLWHEGERENTGQ